MTRAGEKLYGDWDRRVNGEARSTQWRRVAYAIMLAALVIVIGGSALFGF